ncbi:MAG: hypothetical protein JXA10_17375 [Anaerolineae bacterium]|nr:hypothetical protein [Anaerolineae bacterium]
MTIRTGMKAQVQRAPGYHVAGRCLAAAKSSDANRYLPHSRIGGMGWHHLMVGDWIGRIAQNAMAVAQCGDLLRDDHLG